MNFSASKTAKGVIGIIRPFNCLMVAVAILATVLILNGISGFTAALEKSLLGAVSAFLLCAAGNTLNDYFDLRADRKNRPNRPLPSGLLKKSHALTLSVILFASALYISTFVSAAISIITVFLSLLLVIYSVYSKKLGLLGNVIVSFIVAMVIVYGGVLANSIWISLYMAIPIFLINLSRELVKDIEDMKGDSIISKNSFPLKYGVKQAINLASIATILGSLALIYLYNFYGIVYVMLLLPSLYMFSGTIFRTKKITSLIAGKLSKNIKIGSAIAILALVISSLM